MALVNYGSSDESAEDDNPTEDSQPMSSRTESVVTNHKSSEVSANKSLFSRLPEPKVVSNQSTTHSSSLSDITVQKSSSGPIKIFVPSLKYYAEEEEDEDIDSKKTKRFKGSHSGTGLTSMLPKPKNTKTLTKTTISSLIPQSLTRPKANSSVPKRPQTVSKVEEAKETEEPDGNVNYFFSDEVKEEKSDYSFVNEMALSDVEFGPKRDSTPVSSSIASEPSSVQSTAGYALDDITYKKLIASKFGEEAPDDINIVDIDVSKHLSESKDWLKTISQEKEEPVLEGAEISSTARRKHQISFLALQAKAREVELKNEWARSRQTKTMSRQKYGF